MKEKNHQFRIYDEDKLVKKTYREMQQNQNLLFVRKMKRKFTSKHGVTDTQGNKIRKRLFSVFEILDRIIDESDPDTKLPQIFHAYQTGESLRKHLTENNTLNAEIRIETLFSPLEWQKLPQNIRGMYPVTLHQLFPEIKDWSWLPLIGFIHDLGKVMASPEWGGLPQWSVVGDTFPVGEAFSEANVYYAQGFFKQNPDLMGNKNKERKLGFENLTMSFGHDEYIYNVINRTTHHLPQEALYIMRFHSFYPWHTPRNGVRGYEELASAQDWKLLPLLKLFQKSDLYSKTFDIPDIKQLETYYRTLVEKFIPGRADNHYTLRPAQILW